MTIAAVVTTLRRASIVSRPNFFLALTPAFPGRSPTSSCFTFFCGHSRFHHGRFTTSALPSDSPQRLQNFRAGGLPSPHSPQMRSPGCSRRVGLVFWIVRVALRGADGCMASGCAGSGFVGAIAALVERRLGQATPRSPAPRAAPAAASRPAPRGRPPSSLPRRAQARCARWPGRHRRTRRPGRPTDPRRTRRHQRGPPTGRHRRHPEAQADHPSPADRRTTTRRRPADPEAQAGHPSLADPEDQEDHHPADRRTREARAGHPSRWARRSWRHPWWSHPREAPASWRPHPRRPGIPAGPLPGGPNPPGLRGRPRRVRLARSPTSRYARLVMRCSSDFFLGSSASSSSAAAIDLGRHDLLAGELEERSARSTERVGVAVVEPALAAHDDRPTTSTR